MRLRGRQARFLMLVLGCWVLVRTGMSWPGQKVDVAPRIGGEQRMTPEPFPFAEPFLTPTPMLPKEREFTSFALPAGMHPSRFRTDANAEIPASRTLLRAVAFAEGRGAAAREKTPEQRLQSTRAKGDAAAELRVPVPMPAPLPQSASRRIEAQAYVFARAGSGRALSSGSALGGSQAAARIAVPIDAAGHIAAAGRLYAPLNGNGAEAALGLDWRPLAGTPLRVSIERRQRLDSAGRSAWSAYAAGGFYRAVSQSIRVDGYAQAGVVGVHSRDLFADGGLRAERVVRAGTGEAGLGAGIWGAAQPGAERIDAGPRASARLPLSGRVLSLAVEGRFRVAGRSRPGSGVAVTLATDL